MHRNSAMTITEVVIVLAILVVLVALLLPVLGLFSGSGSRHGGSRQMYNSTQVRGIHTGLVLHAQGNNSHYLGIMSDGVTIDPAVGLTTQGRVQKLIDENYLTIEYARSPSEVQTGTTSYAMLKVDVAVDEETEIATIAKSIRNSEWRDTTNTEAIAISDRAVDNGSSYTHIKSIHTKPSANTTDWRGSVGWNDNHVTFESTLNHTTKYGSNSGSNSPGAANHTSDHLFASDAPANNGNDAFMVWTGSDEI